MRHGWLELRDDAVAAQAAGAGQRRHRFPNVAAVDQLSRSTNTTRRPSALISTKARSSARARLSPISTATSPVRFVAWYGRVCSPRSVPLVAVASISAAVGTPLNARLA